MVKITNIFGDRYSGQAGKAGVFANWKGRQYRREYVVPSNPNTAQQQTIRSSFTVAVDKWHTFLSVMRLAYGYMATGLTMSGFNLYVSRWQKMTAGERSAYVEPYTGMVQVADGEEDDITQISTVQSQAAYQSIEYPLVLGSIAYTPATSGVALYGIVDLERGRVNCVKSDTGVLSISYTALGRTITKEALKTNPVDTETYNTDFFPIDPGSVKLYLGDTEKDGLEVGIRTGLMTFTKTAPGNATGDIDGKYYTAVAGAKLETRKVDTNFITWRGYSDEDGIILSAQTSEDGSRDLALTASGFQSVIKANISALDACKDQLVELASA